MIVLVSCHLCDLMQAHLRTVAAFPATSPPFGNRVVLRGAERFMGCIQPLDLSAMSSTSSTTAPHAVTFPPLHCE